MTLEAREDKEESLGNICLCIWLPAMKQFCHDFPIRLLAGKASLNILMLFLVERGKKEKHQFCGSWGFSTNVLSNYILHALLYIIKKFKNANKFTLGPINLSAKYEVTNTRERRAPKPSIDPSSQLLCFNDLLAWKKSGKSHWGLPGYFRSSRTMLSSKVWIASIKKACAANNQTGH